MIIEGGLMFDKGGHSRQEDTPSINFFTAATLGCRKINLIVGVFCSSINDLHHWKTLCLYYMGYGQ